MRTFHFLRKIHLFGMGLAMAAAAMSFIAPASAYAEGAVPLLCNGHNSTMFSPGITDAIQAVTYTGNDTFACTVPLGDTQLTGGTDQVTVVDAPLSCDNLFPDGTEHRVVTYHWNDGVSSSTITYTAATVATVNGDLVITESGTITAGNGAGDTAVLVTTMLSGILNNCEAPAGQVSMAGQLTLTILPI